MDYLKRSKTFYIFILLILGSVLWFQFQKFHLVHEILSVTIRTLLIPSIISIFIYYMLKPLYLFIYRFLKKKRLSIALCFFLLILIVTIMLRQLLPMIMNQVDSLMQSLPQLIEEFDKLLVTFDIIGLDTMNGYLSIVNTSIEDLINFMFVGVLNSTTVLFNLAASSFFILSLVPIFVYYLLVNTGTKKDAPKIIPQKYKQFSLDFYREIEQSLSNYITKKGIVCFYVFVGAFIIFKIAGVPNAFLLAVIAGLMDIIPYFGPWIGAFPAFLVALIIPDANMLLVIIGIVLVQLGETYIVSPFVMSKGLKMNPTFIILLMLITGQLFGLIGMIIILPVIAVVQVCLKYLLLLKQMNSKISDVEQPEIDN